MRRFLESKLVTYYGNVFALLLLCAYYSAVTIQEQNPVSPRVGRQLARYVIDNAPDAGVVVVAPSGEQNTGFTTAIIIELGSGGVYPLVVVNGTPADAARALRELGEQGTRVDFVITQYASARWPILTDNGRAKLGEQFPSLNDMRVIKPSSYSWPTFLLPGNLRTVFNTTATTAIVAIGMTMVIITAGIDLSVGSLLALSGVAMAVAAQKLSGDADPTVAHVMMGVCLAVGLCALIGLFSGVMVTAFDIPAFIVTLAVMQIARGLAFTTAGGPTPVKISSDAFHSLGGGEILGIPNPVIVMGVLYLMAHVLMSHTALGRYIYAVGGNAEAARLSGVPVKRVLLFTYLTCGALAGIGGVLDASLFSVGSANAGTGAELQIIAAVVVGGTSLAGGEGKVLGTLIGALILSVIRNGMNLTNVDSYTQMIVFGALIVIAVFLDRMKARGWRFFAG